MKVVVKEMFVDKDDQLKAYMPGDTVEFDSNRAKALAKRGLVELEKSETVVNKAVKKVTKKPSK